jgi:xylulokinase
MKLPVHVPRDGEAAAMGGALQALWCAERATRNAVSIESVVAEHVALDDGATVTPDDASMQACDAAYASYTKYLAALSPLYR